MIRVFIVAASSLARTGLQGLVGAREIEVVGSATNLESLGGRWADAEADVVLIDAGGEPLEEAVESLAGLQLASEAALVILSDHGEPGSLGEALRAGVRAVLPGDSPATQIVAALEAVAAGLIVVHPAQAGAMFPAARAASRTVAELAEPLTPREREVLQMLASGLANKEIAARLAISEHTAKFHVASILGKLGAASRTEAVSIGIRRGLVLL
ncbi:MAG: response regulator transcription factor [Acidobacteriia bacterium]|nr:response regulator transcription factor [Terriglobia bacterium]